MNAQVNALYAEYPEQTGDTAAAAALTLADTMQRMLDAGPRTTAPDQPMTVPEVAKLLRVTTMKVLR
jgi:hypothetical protein